MSLKMFYLHNSPIQTVVILEGQDCITRFHSVYSAELLNSDGRIQKWSGHTSISIFYNIKQLLLLVPK